MDCLEPKQWLNDSIINFYLTYIVRELMPKEEQKHVHIFNTFFYFALTGHLKKTNGIDFDIVKKWTKNVDIFKKKLIIVPIFMQ